MAEADTDKPEPGDTSQADWLRKNEPAFRPASPAPEPPKNDPNIPKPGDAVDRVLENIGKFGAPVAAAALAVGEAVEETRHLVDKLKKPEGKEKPVPDTFIEVQAELKKLVTRQPGSEWEDSLLDKQQELVDKATEDGVLDGPKSRIKEVFATLDYQEAVDMLPRLASRDPQHAEIDGRRTGEEDKRNYHAMVREYYDVAYLLSQYSLKKASGQDDPRMLREIDLRSWGTPPFVDAEAMARKYLEKFKTPTQVDVPEGREEAGMAQMLEKLMGGIQEGTNKEATPGLLGFLRDMELSEDLDPYNVGLDMKRALNEGKFTREFILAIDAWVGLLRLNKVMEDGGGRYELVEEALRSHNKFNGFVSKPGIARLLQADAGITECYISLLGELGIEENATGAYTLDSVFQKSGKDIDVAIQKLISDRKDSTRVKAAYTILRVLGYYQGVGHAEDFVVKNFIKPRKDGKDPDLDKEDLCIWFEEKKIPLADYGIDVAVFRERYKNYVADRRRHGKECQWYADGKGSLRDVLELGGREKFLKALGEDNKRGALFKYWEDNKKRRGTLLAVSGNRNVSSGLSFTDRYKTIVGEVTKADQVDWLFNESPNPDSETVRRLCDQSKIYKAPPSVGVDPSSLNKEVAIAASVAQDINKILEMPGNFLKALFGKK